MSTSSNNGGTFYRGKSRTPKKEKVSGGGELGDPRIEPHRSLLVVAPAPRPARVVHAGRGPPHRAPHPPPLPAPGAPQDQLLLRLR